MIEVPHGRPPAIATGMKRSRPDAVIFSIANMVMLGAFLKKTGVVALGSVLFALKAVLPARRISLLSLNEAALRCGGDVCPS